MPRIDNGEMETPLKKGDIRSMLRRGSSDDAVDAPAPLSKGQRGGTRPPVIPASPGVGLSAARDATPSAGPSSAPSPASAQQSISFATFVGEELGWGLALPWRRRAKRPATHIVNFLAVPLRLEPLLSFGHALCFDLFLFQFTSLPLRCIAALLALVNLTLGRLL
jgi:hypothetical protein